MGFKLFTVFACTFRIQCFLFGNKWNNLFFSPQKNQIAVQLKGNRSTKFSKAKIWQIRLLVSCHFFFFMRNRQSKIRLTFPKSIFLGCGENIDPQKEVTEETQSPQNEAKAGKVQLKKTVLMPNWNYSEISKVNSGKVHIFWEGHKILRNLHLTFDYSTYSTSIFLHHF